jgi:hypothetical protein
MKATFDFGIRGRLQKELDRLPKVGQRLFDSGTLAGHIQFGTKRDVTITFSFQQCRPLKSFHSTLSLTRWAGPDNPKAMKPPLPALAGRSGFEFVAVPQSRDENADRPPRFHERRYDKLFLLRFFRGFVSQRGLRGGQARNGEQLT